MNADYMCGLLTRCDAVPSGLENQTNLEVCSIGLDILFDERTLDDGRLFDASLALPVKPAVAVGFCHAWATVDDSEENGLPSIRYRLADRLRSTRRRERTEWVRGVGIAGVLFAMAGWLIVLSML